MAGKWVTLGKGNDSRPIMVGEPADKKATTLGLYDAPEVQTLPEAHLQFIETLGVLVHMSEEEIEDQLQVKEDFVQLQSTFTDPDAYDQLQTMVRHLFHRYVDIETHLRALNRNGLKNGVDLKYLYNTYVSIGRESRELRDIMKNLPQYDTTYGREATTLQDNITKSLEKSAQTIMSYMQKDFRIPSKKKRTPPENWQHLNKGALKRYAKRSSTVFSPKPDPEISDAEKNTV